MNIPLNSKLYKTGMRKLHGVVRLDFVMMAKIISVDQNTLSYRSYPNHDFRTIEIDTINYNTDSIIITEQNRYLNKSKTSKLSEISHSFFYDKDVAIEWFHSAKILNNIK